MSGNTHDIAGRMADFFEREIHLLEEMRDDLPALSECVGQEDPSAIAEAQKRREQALDTLAREFKLLVREWNDTSGLSQDERRKIEKLSARAQALLVEVRPLLDRTIAHAKEGLAKTEVSIAGLRRGKQLLHAYKARERGEGSGLDRIG